MVLLRRWSTPVSAGILSVFLFAQHAAAAECYSLFQRLRDSSFKRVQLGDQTPVIVTSAGTEFPITRALEKEGLLYDDIAGWFPSVKPETADKMRERLKQEMGGQKAPNLMKWLTAYPTRYKPADLPISPAQWRKLPVEQQLERIVSQPDFFRSINMNGKRNLFLDDVITFDELAVTDATLKGLNVGDDLGSYEVKSSGGIADRSAYQAFRDKVEANFGGEKVGHQHIVHAWPKSASARAAMAPQYLELLDSMTWLLFWRQMKRNPEDVESVLAHPYLGVYSKDALDRLHESVVAGDASKFKNKYRMVGARALPGDKTIPGQENLILPDFELRSGNKGPMRGFFEDLAEARIGSGDYSGLNDYRKIDFDASAPMDRLASLFLNASEVQLLERFQDSFPKMKYSGHKRALNHYRNRIISPLLPWQNRLELGTKAALLQSEQVRYAKRLVKVAEAYFADMARSPNKAEVSEIYSATIERLEKAIYDFSTEVRLDRDLARYLTPKPGSVPKILVKSSGPIDVNQVGLGIEYTFRFPVRAKDASQADAEIRASLEEFKVAMGGGTIESLSKGGHGHGASIRYQFTDKSGKEWRFEWDGVSRDYVDGKVTNPRGGLLEVPTPKFAPEDVKDIQALYAAARKTGKLPKRSAGGGHVNVDLSPLMKLPPKEGAGKLASLINYFESNRDMISFLWQHPGRSRVAIPVEPKGDLHAKLDAFDGDWNQLAKLLYDGQYFNTHVGRKPRYVQMDVTGAILPAVPEQYVGRDIDIKNPKVEWVPDFGKGKDRIEFRMFDAMEDEYFAALEIKYIRALMDKTFNSSSRIKYQRPASGLVRRWTEEPRDFVAAAEAHLRELGLDVEEFRPLLVQSWEQRAYEKAMPTPAPKKFENFLPSKLENSSTGAISPRLLPGAPEIFSGNVGLMSSKQGDQGGRGENLFWIMGIEGDDAPHSAGFRSDWIARGGRNGLEVPLEAA